MSPFHYITRYMGRNRFQELHMRYRAAAPQITDVYDKKSALNDNIIMFTNNVIGWAIVEAYSRYELASLKA